MTAAKGKAGLGKHEGADVLTSTIAVKGAGDGLSKAMDLEPTVLHRGDKVFVVLECEVGTISFPPIKDTDGISKLC